MTTAEPRALTGGVPDPAAGLHILIAEDRADCAESLAMLLRLFGHEVEIARDGPAALEAVRADEPDVVLLDLGLPGMSGYEVAQRISGHRAWKNKKAPLLIAVTGFGHEADRRHSAEVGIGLHMVKPIEPEQLRAVLERFRSVLHAPPGAGEFPTEPRSCPGKGRLRR